MEENKAPYTPVRIRNLETLCPTHHLTHTWGYIPSSHPTPNPLLWHHCTVCACSFNALFGMNCESKWMRDPPSRPWPDGLCCSTAETGKHKQNRENRRALEHQLYKYQLTTGTSAQQNTTQQTCIYASSVQGGSPQGSSTVGRCHTQSNSVMQKDDIKWNMLLCSTYVYMYSHYPNINCIKYFFQLTITYSADQWPCKASLTTGVWMCVGYV